MFKRGLFFLFLFVVAACQLSGPSSGKEFRQRELRKLEVMSYNLENLFDTKHDMKEGEHLQDYMYLPLNSEIKRSGCQSIRSNYWQKKCFETDWTQEKLELKISQLTRVIKRGEKGEVPDILAVSEIENETVAKLLAQSLGYDEFVITSGDDERGIEVALFYRKLEDAQLKFLSQREHKKKGRSTRSILEMQFQVGGQHRLVIYVNHWPSQGSPTQARLEQAKLLADLMKKQYEVDPKVHLLAVGDFNTLSSERPHPFEEILKKEAKLQDLHERFGESDFVKRPQKSQQALGTYFYAPKMSWNLLDRVFLSPNLADHQGLEVLSESYEIYAPDFAVKKHIVKDKSSAHFGSVIQGVPQRANFKTTQADQAGFSDHFPVVFELAYE